MKLKPSYIVARLFILFIAVCAGVMLWITVPQADDADCYAKSYELLNSLGKPFVAPDFVADLIDNYLNGNARFSNPITWHILIYMPHWLLGIANGLITLGLLSLMWGLACFDSKPSKNRALLLSLVGILSLIAIPWNDSMFVFSFSFNYIWHGAMALLGTLLFCKLCFDRGKQMPKWQISLICLLMLLIGSFHEGSAGCLLGGLAIIWFTLPRDRRLASAIPLCFLTLGLISIIVAPGLHEKADATDLSLHLTGWFQSYKLTGGIYLYPHNVLPILFVAANGVIALCRRKQLISTAGDCVSRGWLYGWEALPLWLKMELLCVSVACLNLVVSIIIPSPRASTLGNIFSIIGTIILLKHYLPEYAGKKSVTALGWIAAICGVILSINLLFTLNIQQRISNDHQAIQQLLEQSEDGAVYYDPIQYSCISRYPWQWENNKFYTNPYPLYFLLFHPNNNFNKPLRLLPTALRNIPDSIPFNRIQLYKGNFISDHEPELPEGAEPTEIFPEIYPYFRINADVVTSNGNTEIRFFEVIPFRSANRQLYYFRPVYASHAQIADPAISILSAAPAKYW